MRFWILKRSIHRTQKVNNSEIFLSLFTKQKKKISTI